MGMTPRIGAIWDELNVKYLEAQQRASDVGGGFGAVSRVMRMVLQSAMLGIGAYLVIQQEATAGIIIAGSILAARALAPVDLAIAHWRSFVGARQSWRRLKDLLAAFPPRTSNWPCPSRHRALRWRGSASCRPATARSSCRTWRSGSRRGTASASLARTRPGNRALRARWSGSGSRRGAPSASTAPRSTSGRPKLLGRHIGYLPQDVELFSGTVAQNIARFETESEAGRRASRPRRPPASTS